MIDFQVVSVEWRKFLYHCNDIIAGHGVSLLVLRGLFHCLCGAISEAFSLIESSDTGKTLVGSTFNIQNSIPHKSQKTKAASETNRAKEFQRGTAGVAESAKESGTGLSEGSDIGLGAGCRRFESCHSDHMNEVRFSNIFIEKRTSHFLKALQLQGFFVSA